MHPSHPYPSHLIKHQLLRDGTAVTLRPISAGDAQGEATFVRNVSDESRYYRFMEHLHELSPGLLSHLIEIDYHDYSSSRRLAKSRHRNLATGASNRSGTAARTFDPGRRSAYHQPQDAGADAQATFSTPL